MVDSSNQTWHWFKRPGFIPVNKSCVEITSGNQEQQGNLGATAENCFPTRNRIVHAKLMKMDAESEGYIAREVIGRVRYPSI